MNTTATFRNAWILRTWVVTLTAAAAAVSLTPARAATGNDRPAHSQPQVLAQAAPCRHCGVVESVAAVQRQGQPRGIAGTAVTPGMAIGGVVGGLVGNQVGHGGGRAAATVLGAAGGAYAGHAIEKNRVKYTAYVMHIRMHDGSMRTIEQRNALRRGAAVIVEGNIARLAPAGAAHG